MHQVVGHSDGYVQVNSKVDVGTTFAIFLPLATQQTTTNSAPPVPSRGGSERILVVDDERIQLRTAERILKQHGYRVSTASSALAALALFDENMDDPFELVILDMLMPGSLNGLATLRLLRERRPLQKALIVSGYAPEQMGREAAEHSVRWLAKPYDNAGLASAVRTVLETPAQES